MRPNRYFNNSEVLQTETYRSYSIEFPKELERPLKVVINPLETLIYLGTFLYNNPCIYRFKCDFEYLASNQVVGGPNPSGHAIRSKELGHLTKGSVHFPLNVVMSAVETLAGVLNEFEINTVKMRTSAEISLL